MELVESNINISDINDFPTLDEIRNIERGIYLKINLNDSAKKHQQEKGEYLRKILPEFSIGIHTNGIEINIKKLITEQEIIEHQDFFENCAKEYGHLGERLINEFITLHNIPPHNGFPLKQLNGYFRNKNHNQRGAMGDWDYFFHGFHCSFTNRKSKQEIEVPLTYGEEYGELDPYFFSIFIKTTPSYSPLPVEIYDDYNDGKRILEIMLQIEKFEMINSNIGRRQGFIVKDRIKKEVIQDDNGLENIMLKQKIIVKRPFWKRWLNIK